MFRSRFSAYRIYWVFAAASALFFATFSSLSSVYRVEVAGLGAFQLILIGTVLELSVLLFELPTGIVADTYSRRLSVIVGMVLIGAGFILEGALPLFVPMLLAQVVWGVGYTFESGALDAWISDEIGVEAANRAFLRAAQVGQVFAIFGLGLATLLGTIYLGLPLVVGGIGYLGLAVFLTLFMPESGFVGSGAGERNPAAAMRRTFRAGIAASRSRPVLLTLFAISVVLGASSETFDRLWVAHLLNEIPFPSAVTLAPAVWFGLIGLLGLVPSLIGTEIARRRVDVGNPGALARVLFATTSVQMVGVIAFGLAGEFTLALGSYYAVVLTRTVNAPLLRAWVNQGLEPGVRATVFSMTGQMDALGQIVGGPLLGLLAQAAGLPPAFVVSGLLLLPALWLYRRIRGLPPAPPGGSAIEVDPGNAGGDPGQ